jgi:DNA polymerase
MILHIDFETASAVDLKIRGQDVYARDPSTRINCMAWAFDDHEPQIWRPGDPFPLLVQNHVNQDGEVWAYNASFEIAIWNHCLLVRHKESIGCNTLEPEQCRCTMAMAQALAIPGSLDNAASALGLAWRKDLEGYKVMMDLAVPIDLGPPIRFNENPSQHQRLAEYCKTDVRVERELGKRCLSLSEEEQQIWRLDWQVNQRGVGVDLRAVASAIRAVEIETKRLDGELRRVTGGHVTACTQRDRLARWLEAQGAPMDSLAKADIAEALEDQTLPALAREALELRREAAKASTAKLKPFLVRTGSDARLRGTVVYHGAATGRWAGRGVQLHNLPRGKLHLSVEEQEQLFAWLADIDPAEWLHRVRLLYGEPMQVLSDLLRGFLVAAPGHEFVALDLAQIEARALAWLAHDQGTLNTFARGEDVYRYEASGIFGIPPEKIDKDQRQVGKVANLALGYGGGRRAFVTMGANYGVHVPEAHADEIKKAWRAAHPRIVAYWASLERAAINAVLRPGERCVAGWGTRLTVYRVVGSFLLCKLPSNRVIAYPYPKIQNLETPWGEMKDTLTYMAVNDKTRKWDRAKTHGGKLAENVTQAICRDLLKDGMVRLEAAGYPVVLHVHDEAVVEVPIGSLSLEEGLRVMSIVPAWANGMPISATGWVGRRYRKE